jgi:hypothetical protein
MYSRFQTLMLRSTEEVSTQFSFPKTSDFTSMIRWKWAGSRRTRLPLLGESKLFGYHTPTTQIILNHLRRKGIESHIEHF